MCCLCIYGAGRVSSSRLLAAFLFRLSETFGDGVGHLSRIHFVEQIERHGQHTFCFRDIDFCFVRVSQAGYFIVEIVQFHPWCDLPIRKAKRCARNGQEPDCILTTSIRLSILKSRACKLTATFLGRVSGDSAEQAWTERRAWGRLEERSAVGRLAVRVGVCLFRERSGCGVGYEVNPV